MALAHKKQKLASCISCIYSQLVMLSYLDSKYLNHICSARKKKKNSLFFSEQEI